MKKIVSVIGSLGVFLIVFMVACQETTDETEETLEEVDPIDLSLSLDGGTDFVKTFIVTELNGVVLNIPQVQMGVLGYTLRYSIEEVLLGDEMVMEYPFAAGVDADAGKIVFDLDAEDQVRDRDIVLPAAYTIQIKVTGTNADKDSVSTRLTLKVNLVEPSSLSIDVEGGTDFIKTYLLDEDLDGAAFDIPQVMVIDYTLRYRITEVMLTSGDSTDVVDNMEYPFALGSDMNAGKIVFAADAVEKLTTANVELPATYTIDIEVMGTNADMERLSTTLRVTVRLMESSDEVQRPLFTSSRAMSTFFYMYQMSSSDHDLRFEHSGEEGVLTILPEAITSKSLESGQEIFYQVVVDDNIQTGYFEFNQITRRVRMNPVAYGLFDPRTNSAIEVGATIPMSIRAYVAHDHDDNPETPVEVIDDTLYDTFVITLRVKGPRLEFTVNEATGAVHLNCRCAGEMGLTGDALNDFYTVLSGEPRISVNGNVPNVILPPDSSISLSELTSTTVGYKLGFEVLTNGHPDLPAGETTPVLSDHFEIMPNRADAGRTGIGLTLALVSPKVHALWADSPSSIDSRITTPAATGNTRTIFVKGFIREYDTDTSSYVPADPTVFDILKVTVTVGGEM